jgi:hypothetical protein
MRFSFTVIPPCYSSENSFLFSLSGYELLYLRVVVGVVVLVVAGLAVAGIVPCVHHLGDV